MSGYSGRSINEVFPYTITYPDKELAREIMTLLFEADVSFAVTQDKPHTFRMSEEALLVLVGPQSGSSDE